jgi:hypothetical protein
MITSIAAVKTVSSLKPLNGPVSLKECRFCYAVSESASATIVDIAPTLGASRLILGAPPRNARLIFCAEIWFAKSPLPEKIDLIVYA